MKNSICFSLPRTKKTVYEILDRFHDLKDQKKSVFDSLDVNSSYLHFSKSLTYFAPRLSKRDFLEITLSRIDGNSSYSLNLRIFDFENEGTE